MNGLNIAFSLRLSIRPSPSLRVKRLVRRIIDHRRNFRRASAAGGRALRCGSGRPDGPYWSRSPRTIQFPPFTALLVRRAVFQEVGGLDEVFESYLEDVEFGLRCASRRYTGMYEPRAVATHLGSATLGRWNPITVRNIARNQVLLVARHYDRAIALRRFGWAIAVSQLCGEWSRFDMAPDAAWIGGKLDGLRLFRLCRGRGHPHVPEYSGRASGRSGMFKSSTGFDWYWRIYLTSHSAGSTIEMPGIVVVTYNSADVIDSCLDACLRLTEDTVVLLLTTHLSMGPFRESVQSRPAWG